MRHPIRTIALAAVATILLTGCSISYPFQLLLTVENEDGGQPLEDVTIVLDTTDADDNMTQTDYGVHFRGTTDSSGGLTHDFHITQAPDFYKHWSRPGSEQPRPNSDPGRRENETAAARSRALIIGTRGHIIRQPSTPPTRCTDPRVSNSHLKVVAQIGPGI